MDPLEEYIQTTYPIEKREIRTIDEIIGEVWPVFADFLRRGKGWPYEIADRDSNIEVTTQSSSTNAMILFIIAQLLGRVQKSELLPSVSRRFVHQEGDDWQTIHRRLRPVFSEGMNVLLQSMQRTNPIFKSGSFGKDDPFTYAWTMALLIDAQDDPEIGETLRATVREKFKILQRSAIARIKEAFAGTPDEVLMLVAGAEPDRIGHPTDHLFPLLRFAHLHVILRNAFPAAKKLENLQNVLTTKVRERFFTRLHEQLSLSVVTNASFDVAELVFALEGYLLSLKDGRAIDTHLIGRVFQVLRDAQDRSAYWRPLKPFVTTPQGYALLPLSVEIANSLLRTCSRLKLTETESYFSRNIDLFRRYAAWLCTRVTRGKAALTGAPETEFTGWHSEHVYVPNRIHPWETSQVLSFFLHYREMLQDHVANTALVKANLDVKPPHVIQGAPAAWNKRALSRHLLKFEPLSEQKTSNSLSVYPLIIDRFLIPRLRKPPDNGNLHQSMLLYGPPGTGKSTAPEQMAGVLGWPLITVTPSDFIARGEAEVEARAKLIFKTLQEQTDKIILFDEIDRLILDRDSKYYHDQNDMFQFMTPGMLVKLKDLRNKGRSIFVIATNYEERIDSAATRKGRIDFTFLIAPPDREKRIMLIKEELVRALKQKRASLTLTDKEKKQIATITEGIFSDDCARTVGNRTALMTYGELKQVTAGAISLLRTAADIDAAGTKASLDRIRKQLVRDILDAEAPGIRLTSYFRRFRSQKKGERPPEGDHFPVNQEPLIEFFILLYIRAEVMPDEKLSAEEHDVIERAFRRIMPDGVQATKSNAKSTLNALIKDKRVCAGILTQFPFPRV